VRLAVFSDVHGNLTALQAVLADIEREGPFDDIIFAGDLCMFGPRPSACVATLRERVDVQTLVGNTDEWIFALPPIDPGLDEAVRQRRQYLHAVAAWIGEGLEAVAVAWLGDLRGRFSRAYAPGDAPADRLLVVHANPRDLLGVIFPAEARQRELYGRVRQPDAEIEPLLDGVEAGMVAFGHLHIPDVRPWRGKVLVNVSSVTIPGDGDGRAKYAILTWAAGRGWAAEHRYVAHNPADEIAAFEQYRPPGWEESVRALCEHGYVPQSV
jgi:predicted phosphodiesterase